MAQNRLTHALVGNERKFKSSKINENAFDLKSSRLNFMSSSGTDERDGGNKGIQGNSGNLGSGHNGQENSSGSAGREDKRNKPPSHIKGCLTFNEEDMKKESKRFKTFSKIWPHEFLLPKDLAKAGFYYVADDIVRCAFCKIEVGRWELGDIPRKEHRRWSPNCPFIRGVPCGNIPIRENDASSSSSDGEVFGEDSSYSYDVCGIHQEMRPFSFCDDETSSFAKPKPIVSDIHGEPSELPRVSLEKLGIRDMRAPVHPEYCSEAARIATYNQWPMAMKQRPRDLSQAGFYYTGNGDQTICFHCGGGLKDWEDGDEPWVEHAKWFSKCPFLNLVKGTDFISQVTESSPALLTAEEVRNLANPVPTASAQETESTPGQVDVQNAITSSSSSTNTTTVENTEMKSVENQETKDDGRLCKICYSAELGVVFLPCGHMVACVRCAPSLTVCPVCRQPFSHTIRAFIS